MARDAIEKAREKGLLPHEWLLKVMHGDMEIVEEKALVAPGVDGSEVTVVVRRRPTFEERLDAAKAAAPYFAPKLAAIEQKVEVEIESVISAEPLTIEEWDARYASGVGSSTGTPESVN